MRPGEVAEVLGRVFDPELGLDLVSLGLVYGIAVEGARVSLQLTMTSAGCPMGGAIIDSAEAAFRSGFPAASLEVDVTFDPPWHVDMASAEARQWLGLPARR